MNFAMCYHIGFSYQLIVIAMPLGLHTVLIAFYGSSLPIGNSTSRTYKLSIIIVGFGTDVFTRQIADIFV